MPRDAFGIYTLPTPQNPVVSGQTISAADFNTTMDDIATALTESLNTDGTASFDAPLQMVNGTSAAPGYTFAADVSTGLFRSASTGLGLSVAGAERFRAGSALGGFNAIDVQFVPGASWPAVGGQVGPQVAASLGAAGTDVFLQIRRVVVTSAASPYTLTTTVGARRLFFRACGGGGGGGGLPATTTTNMAVSSGGGGGEYAEYTATGTAIEATYTITIGGGGAGGVASAGGNAGTAGSDTTVVGGTSSTTRLRAKGGSGGATPVAKSTAAATDPPTVSAAGAAGGTGGTGDVLLAGQASAASWNFVPASGYGVFTISYGGCSPMFSAPTPPNTSGVLPGQGGGGRVVYETTAAGGTAGYDGAAGICIFEEYL